MKRNIFMILPILAFLNCSRHQLEMISTTENDTWKSESSIKIVVQTENPDVIIETSNPLQTIEGFGTCFNELGWTSLSVLSENDREIIMKELFAPDFGANFSICRMPVAANDFSRDWYSYDETEGDFKMEHFSIENDFETLIPFIKNAQKYNHDLKIWASPWSPPTWMKYNKHYAARSILGDSDFNSEEWGMDLSGINNGLPANREGKEGTDMFIKRDEFYKAYALYFARFIQAYRDQNINIFMVMPQNEFNSTQIFPSCTWTAKGLATFTGRYLGPEMKKLNVEVMFGTMERPTEALVDTILGDTTASRYISGLGFQWAGKSAIPGIHQRYPHLRLYQTEQECGNGKNDWTNCKYSWSLLKHYLSNGANAYMYWNTSLKQGGISTWGWKQNSLISVDTLKKTYKYNYEYYLMKHVSHFVKPGAKLLKTSGSVTNLLAFKNTDNSLIMIIQNDEKTEKQITVKTGNKYYQLTLKPDSFNTISVK
jgi:glucosylceramidase